MKTYLAILALLTFMLSGFSQSKPIFPTDSKEKMKSNHVKIQVQWKYRPGATEGRKILSKSFDKEGNVLEELNFKPDGSKSSRLTYKYDEKGNKIYYQLYDFNLEPDKKVRYLQNIKYNEHGDRISETGYDGVSNFRIEYKYVSPAKLKEIIKYDDQDNITERRKYEYSKNIMTISTINRYGNITEIIREEYDGNNNIIKKEKLKPDHTVTSLYLYKYDEHKRLKTEEEYFSGKFSYMLNYGYSTDGNLISIDKEDSEGGKFRNNSFSYNQNGNIIEESWFDGVPDDYSKKVYGYDEKDNVKEVDSYYSLYKYKVLYKYTYDYY